MKLYYDNISLNVNCFGLIKKKNAFAIQFSVAVFICVFVGINVLAFMYACP